MRCGLLLLLLLSVLTDWLVTGADLSNLCSLQLSIFQYKNDLTLCVQLPLLLVLLRRWREAPYHSQATTRYRLGVLKDNLCNYATDEAYASPLDQHHLCQQ